MLIKVLVLAALVFGVTRSGKPLLWAMLYGVAVSSSGFLGGHAPAAVVPSALMAGGLALVYFSLLDRTGNVLLWWFTLIVGLVVMLGIG